MNKRERVLLFVLVVSIVLVAVFYSYHAVYLPKLCAERASHAKTDVAELSRELQSSFACIRSRAAFDLQKVGARGASAVPHLVAALKDSDHSVRWRSIAALGHIGVFNDEVQKAALAELKDPHQTARYNAVFTLSQMSNRTSVEGLSQALEDRDPEVAFRAAQDLSWLVDRDRDKDLLPKIVKHLEGLSASPNEKVRGRAVKTLAALKAPLQPASTEPRNAGADMQNRFLADEFKHIMQRRPLAVEQTRPRREPAFPEDLAGQYIALEKGQKLLRDGGSPEELHAFLCWIGERSPLYRFNHFVFEADLKSLHKLLKEGKGKDRACYQEALAQAEEHVDSSHRFGTLSFDCPAILGM